jgi:hypothetical protein
MKRRIVAAALFVAAGLPAVASAQDHQFQILDNSFLVEEAFNQDKGIFQNIFNWTRARGGGWEGSFTQEWPAPALTHQLSYTIPFSGGGGSPSHVGGVLLNYRYQALEEGAGRPAFAPRFSVILPTGRAIDDSDRPGIQVNLPFSKQLRDVYVHWNTGFTWLHGVASGGNAAANLTSPLFAGSLVWNTRPYLNLMFESVLELEDSVIGFQQTARERVVTLSPGVRGGWTLTGDRQVIVGAAVPITFTEGDHSAAILGYFSYELPFTSNR